MAPQLYRPAAAHAAGQTLHFYSVDPRIEANAGIGPHRS